MRKIYDKRGTEIIVPKVNKNYNTVWLIKALVSENEELRKKAERIDYIHECQKRQRDEYIIKLIKKGYTMKFSDPTNQENFIIIHPSSKKGYKYAASYFDCKGPWSDRQMNNILEAARQVPEKWILDEIEWC